MAFKRSKTGTICTPDEALLRLERWCAFRERSPIEVKRKIIELGQTGEVAEQLYSVLETDGFFNEQRFAEAFAGGKFRVNHWGRNRIRPALKQHQIDPQLIEKALSTITDEEYHALLQQLVARKMAQFQADEPEIKEKTAAYLIRKGFEPEYVFSALNAIQKPDF